MKSAPLPFTLNPFTLYPHQQINRLADTIGIAVIYVAADEPNLITP
ncbi:MAG: hypothetical protein F6K11_29500 [Leptolyngbya sp. SIO3F4]|nr:hypothetical protein [Leptolyngbya sp. SIO3F4]